MIIIIEEGRIALQIYMWKIGIVQVTQRPTTDRDARVYCNMDSHHSSRVDKSDVLRRRVRVTASFSFHLAARDRKPPSPRSLGWEEEASKRRARSSGGDEAIEF